MNGRKDILARAYRPLKPLKPSKRWYICPHCGTYHQSHGHDENGRSQCPNCGTWAFWVGSPEGKQYEKILDEAKKMLPYDKAVELAELTYRRMME